MITALPFAGAVVAWLVLLRIMRGDSYVGTPLTKMQIALRRGVRAIRRLELAFGLALLPAAREATKSMERFGLLVRQATEAEAAALARERGMTLGQYFRAGGAEAMLDREEQAE